MPRYFTHYWTNKTWDWHDKNILDNETLNHVAGNLFHERNVNIGDVIYVVTVKKGQLHLAGKLKVYKICGLSEAKSTLETDDLWDADEHIVASEATPINFRCKIPLEITQKLKFKGSGNLKPLVFSSPGYLDQQTLRGVRELDEQSALELDKFLPPLRSISNNQVEPTQEKLVAEPTYPDEISESQTYSEGSGKRVLINIYERDPNARQACINHYGLSCQVCGFNFEEFYRKPGKGYIHVHHIIPLSEIGEAYQVNPIEDLRPVCPNCHAMLHKKKPPYQIEELRQMIEENRRNGNG